ncbi:MAG: BatD family protein [Elusimicrobia bacterium]|nr:BatD family protein [Elusimicrobiota bacterium]
MKKILICVFLFATAKVFADVNINASVDRNTVSFGESITLQVIVSGDVANIPKPELPQLTDFNVYSSGTSQNVSFVNGKVSSSITYNFVLSLNKPGKYTIKPVSLTVGGKTYSTNPISIEVLPAGSAPQQKQVVNVDEDEARGIFVTAQLDKKKVFVNEGLIYTFRFFTSRNLLSNPEYNPPNYTGFIVEDLPPQRNYQTTVNGKTYNVIEIKFELFPTSAGTYNLGVASLRTSVQDFSGNPADNFPNDSFFSGIFGSGKSIILKSKPLTVEVVSLPASNKPANFSGTVGKYNISVNTDKSEVEANNPLTVNVTVSGEGNIKSISEPKLPNIMGTRKYDTISSVNISKTNYKVSGSKVFKTVIVPERAGNLIVPELDFSYFDPDKKEYQKVKSSVIQVKVIPSKTPVSAQLPAFGSGVNVVGQDIRFIKTEIGENTNSKITNNLSNGLVIISFLFLIISAGYNRYNFFMSKNYGLIKSKIAFREFNKGIDKMHKRSIEIKDFYGIVFELIVKYISDKTKVTLSGMTFNEMEEVLTQKNLSQKDIKKIRDILEEADFIRFTPSAAQKIDFKEEAKRIKDVIYDIDKGWKL